MPYSNLDAISEVGRRLTKEFKQLIPAMQALIDGLSDVDSKESKDKKELKFYISQAKAVNCFSVHGEHTMRGFTTEVYECMRKYSSRISIPDIVEEEEVSEIAEPEEWADSGHAEFMAASSSTVSFGRECPIPPQTNDFGMGPPMLRIPGSSPNGNFGPQGSTPWVRGLYEQHPRFQPNVRLPREPFGSGHPDAEHELVSRRQQMYAPQPQRHQVQVPPYQVYGTPHHLYAPHQGHVPPHQYAPPRHQVREPHGYPMAAPPGYPVVPTRPIYTDQQIFQPSHAYPTGNDYWHPSSSAAIPSAVTSQQTWYQHSQSPSEPTSTSRIRSFQASTSELHEQIPTNTNLNEAEFTSTSNQQRNAHLSSRKNTSRIPERIPRNPACLITIRPTETSRQSPAMGHQNINSVASGRSNNIRESERIARSPEQLREPAEMSSNPIEIRSASTSGSNSTERVPHSSERLREPIQPSRQRTPVARRPPPQTQLPKPCPSLVKRATPKKLVTSTVSRERDRNPSAESSGNSSQQKQVNRKQVSVAVNVSQSKSPKHTLKQKLDKPGLFALGEKRTKILPGFKKQSDFEPLPAHFEERHVPTVHLVKSKSAKSKKRAVSKSKSTNPSTSKSYLDSPQTKRRCSSATRTKPSSELDDLNDQPLQAMITSHSKKRDMEAKTVAVELNKPTSSRTSGPESAREPVELQQNDNFVITISENDESAKPTSNDISWSASSREFVESPQNDNVITIDENDESPTSTTSVLSSRDWEVPTPCLSLHQNSVDDSDTDAESNAPSLESESDDDLVIIHEVIVPKAPPTSSNTVDTPKSPEKLQQRDNRDANNQNRQRAVTPPKERYHDGPVTRRQTAERKRRSNERSKEKDARLDREWREAVLKENEKNGNGRSFSKVKTEIKQEADND